jgi:stage V sporulation protein SpoVS
MSMIMRVAASTRARSLAGAIAKYMRGGGSHITLQAIGPEAVAQASKAVATAKEMLEQSRDESKLVVRMRWVAVEVDEGGSPGEPVTAMQFDVQREDASAPKTTVAVANEIPVLHV